MKDMFDVAVHVLKEVGTHVLGHLAADKAKRQIAGGPLSPIEGQYLALRDQSVGLSGRREGSASLLALEHEAQAVRVQLSKEYLAHLHAAQQQEVKLRVQEMQANFDNQHWAGVLSRQETLAILTQTVAASQTRLLMIVAEPDVSELCPALFQKELAKEVRGKLKQFLEKYFPAGSDCSVEFYGKFFKSAVFDTEVKQIEHVLAPLHLASIFSDVTRKEIMFHLRLCLDKNAPAFSLATVFPWKEEHKRLMAKGMDEEDSLDAVQDAIIAVHQLLAGLLADVYFLWMNPLYEPRLFTLTSDKFPVGWLDTVFATLRDVQAKRLAEYELALREGLKRQREEEEEDNFYAKKGWGKRIGKFRKNIQDSALTLDTKTGLVWLIRLYAEFTWEGACNFVRRCNKENLRGHADWRLPTSDEFDDLGNDVDGYQKAFSCNQGNYWYNNNDDIGGTAVFEEDLSFVICWSSYEHAEHFVRLVRNG